MYDISIKIKNYKCFEEESGFESIKRVNLIIGKNNSGKSSLLDFIQASSSVNYTFDNQTYRKGQTPEVVFGAIVPEENIAQVFPENTSGGSIRHHANHRMYGNQISGRYIKWTKTGSNNSSTRMLFCENDTLSPPLLSLTDYANSLAGSIRIPIENKIFRRILAERDISPEADTSFAIHPNGAGITTSIQRFINRSNLPGEVVEHDMLLALNEIFLTDAVFTQIICQLHENNAWEIYLEEQGKGRVALSKSGSGLKTVIAVLANLFLVPVMEGKPLHEYIFAFEEIENNMHPSLLRRLSNFIYKLSRNRDFIFFLTTHSNILIDQYSKQDDAQIVHVIHSNGSSICKVAKTYIENHGILDDLDVRASDILQANGIIWVEGPSDRIYLNRWIDLWSNGSLKEGVNYQCIFYGGRLLSHLNASVDEVRETVSILNANRHAIIMMDSDLRKAGDTLGATKNRVCEEFVSIGALSWITAGREVENYIPASVVSAAFKIDNVGQVDQYDSFFDYLDEIIKDEGVRMKRQKPLLAEKLASFMTLENMSEILNLDERMKAVCDEINKWNR